MPVLGNKAVEGGRVGYPGACAEPVQYAELGRPYCELLLRSQIQIGG